MKRTIAKHGKGLLFSVYGFIDQSHDQLVIKDTRGLVSGKIRSVYAKEKESGGLLDERMTFFGHNRDMCVTKHAEEWKQELVETNGVVKDEERGLAGRNQLKDTREMERDSEMLSDRQEGHQLQVWVPVEEKAFRVHGFVENRDITMEKTHGGASFSYPTVMKNGCEFAIDAVDRACRLCVDVKKSLFSSDDKILEKNDQTPVTIADFGVQALVSLELSKLFPSIPLVAEEDSNFLRANNLVSTVVIEVKAKTSTGEDHLSDSDVLEAIDRGGKDAYTFCNKPATYWVLDTIDGTRGFLKGDEALYVVGLTLVVDNEIVLGVMNCGKINLRAMKKVIKRGDNLRVQSKSQKSHTDLLHFILIVGKGNKSEIDEEARRVTKVAVVMTEAISGCPYPYLGHEVCILVGIHLEYKIRFF